MTSIIQNLIKVSIIGPGQTYNIKTKEIVDHNSWYGWFTRFTGSENKKELEDWLDGLYEEAFDYYRSTQKPSTIIDVGQAILESRKGVENLKLTYCKSQDVNFQRIIYSIDCFMAQIHGSFCVKCKVVHRLYSITGRANIYKSIDKRFHSDYQGTSY